MCARFALAAIACVAVALPGNAQVFPQPRPLPVHTHHKDVIYRHKDGTARTLDVFAPKKSNGIGVIICVSMNYQSNQEMLKVLQDYAMAAFLDHGYVVFAVIHGSQPKFTIPEIVDDVHRAVRFIKHSAGQYGIDPQKLGIAGGSSGGHLALMMGCDWKPGNPDAADPVERESSRVAAVACLFPPSDLPAFEKAPPPDFDPALLFPIRELDPRGTNKYVPVTVERRREIGTACSPLYCARKSAAPTLIVHGVQDDLVPIQQSRALDARFKECGATCKLVEIPRMRHSLIQALPHIPTLVNWFDEYLKK
jgi:acetyl esterase/lipase